MRQNGLGIALMLADQVHAQLRHGQVGLTIAFVDRQRLGLEGSQWIGVFLESLQTLAHAAQRPEQIDRGRSRVSQQRKIFLQRCLPVATFGKARTRRQHHAIGGTDADGRRTTHHHGANGLGHARRTGIGDPALFEWQNALIQQVQGAVPPIDGFHFLGCQQSIAHPSPRTHEQKPSIIAIPRRRRSGILRHPL
ncbi:hypothetical protein D3C85_879120 [compost metagenome]